MTLANTLAYYDTATITAVKVLKHRSPVLSLFLSCLMKRMLETKFLRKYLKIELAKAEGETAVPDWKKLRQFGRLKVEVT